MSSLEVGSQFGGLAKTMVASEGSVPNAGWNYAQILLGKISQTTVQDANEIAISFVDEFIKQQNDFALADISVDMAAWDLGKLPSLGESFKTLADNLLKCFESKDAVSYNQMRRILANVHLQCQTYLLEQYVDLGDFCGLLENEVDAIKNEIENEKIEPIIDVGNSCRTVREEIKKCILLTGFSGSDFQFSNGIINPLKRTIINSRSLKTTKLGNAGMNF
jgi:GTPase SAR1 family protein